MALPWGGEKGELKEETVWIDEVEKKATAPWC